MANSFVVDCSKPLGEQQSAIRQYTAQEEADKQAIAEAEAARLSVVAIESGNETTLRQRADAALAANDTYLALASPTNAQNLAQIQRLTKECSALIRLVLRKLDSVAGT